VNIIQSKLVKSYAILVIAKEMTIEEVPESRLIGGSEYPIRSEVEIEISKRTANVL